MMYLRGKERPARTCVIMTNATGLSDKYATLAKLEFQIHNTYKYASNIAHIICDIRI